MGQIMSRRPAVITQADVARIIRAAKQAGAAEVQVPVNGELVIVKLRSSEAPEDAARAKREIVL
jgi:hypothetical protein